MMEMLALIVQMGWRQAGLSVFLPLFVFLCTIKSRRWRAVMEEVDKGCIKFCVTVGTATRTDDILIHSQLKGAGC